VTIEGIDELRFEDDAVGFREGCAFDNREVLSDIGLSREMWSPQTIIPVGEPPPPLKTLKANFAAYGLGWFPRDYHGRELVGHTGGVSGFVSRVILVPEKSLGIVVLTNAEQTGACESIVGHVLDCSWSLPPTDWIAIFKAADKLEQDHAAEVESKQITSRAAGSKPSLPLEKYAGVR
jgi:hypothetical protein